MGRFVGNQRTLRRPKSAFWTGLVVLSLVMPSPGLFAEEATKPFPAFNVVFPTNGLHPEEDNREGIVHGETHQLRYRDLNDLIERIAKIVPVPPAGEPLELSFYLSPMWTPHHKERLTRVMESRFRHYFPNNPLKLELHHPRVPRRLRPQMPQPGVDDILLELKELEDAAPTEADRLPIRKVRQDIENAQPVKVETDEEGAPARLERPEATRQQVMAFGVLKALVTGGLLWYVMDKPGLESTGKSILAWSVILGRFSIDFLATAFAQPFGTWLATHKLVPEKKGRARSFWTRLNDWYCGRRNARSARRAEMIKQAVYNYLLFVLLLTPTVQFAISQTDPGNPAKAMDWAYFWKQAALSFAATCVFVWGASGLRRMRQLGTQTRSGIDKKYGWLGLVNGASDAAASAPMLAWLRYLTMGFMALIQGRDAMKAARATPKINRWVFIDSWLPDEVRSKSIDPLENIDHTRLMGRKKPGESDRIPEGEAENFVNWIVDELEHVPDVKTLRCDEALVEAAAS